MARIHKDLFQAFNAATARKADAAGSVGEHVVVRKAVLLRTDGWLDLTGRRVDWRFVEEQGEKPAHYHARVMGVDIHLRGGLKPEANGKVAGKIEINVRHVSNKEPKKGETPFFLYINLDPNPGGRSSNRVTLTGERPAPDAFESWRGEEREQREKYVNLHAM